MSGMEGVPADWPRAVLFDWDNTLVDNFGCIVAALNAVLTRFDRPTWSVDEAKLGIRHSLRDGFPAIFGERAGEARVLFYETFEARHLEALAAMPHAENLLRRLADSRIPAAVVSNKRGDLLRRECAHLDWDRHFFNLVGANDAARDKPDPAPLDLALNESGMTAGSDIWYVGDLPTDAEFARKCGMHPVIVRADGGLNDEFAAYPEASRFADCGQITAYLFDR